VFQKYCKGCHGEDATGNGPLAPKDVHPPNLTDAEWKYGAGDGEIFTNIHDGIGPKFDMKSWKSRMTDVEIWSVVNYLRSIAVK
jgi:mono/diheme cytochrome c family protein